MVGIILITHGKLAGGLRDGVELIIGTQENFSIIGLNKEDSVDDLPQKIENILNEFINLDGVLVFVDLFGASPFNAAARAVHHFQSIPVNVITGVNLGMLLEVVMQREILSIEELSNLAIDTGKKGIQSFSEFMKKE